MKFAVELQHHIVGPLFGKKKR